MKHTSLVKKLEKLDLIVQTFNDVRYYVYHNGKILNWVKQDDSALVVNVYKEKDAPDMLIDYNPANHVRTIKEAVDSLTK